MCQSKLSWWISGQRIWEKREEDPEKVTYFPVKLCIKCNRVWEEPLKFSEVGRISNLRFHKDFPTYGLKREACNGCKS